MNRYNEGLAFGSKFVRLTINNGKISGGNNVTGEGDINDIIGKDKNTSSLLQGVIDYGEQIRIYDERLKIDEIIQQGDNELLKLPQILIQEKIQNKNKNKNKEVFLLDPLAGADNYLTNQKKERIKSNNI
jgi:hypothetical protein